MALPNDWQIKKCLTVSLSLLLAIFTLIGLAALGFDIPCLRQIVGFILVTFVPGMLLLRIFKIHNISIIESLLYSVGLSLAFAMAVGVVANFALPPLGIPHPITLAPVTITFTALLLLLCFLAYVRDKDFQPVKSLHKSNEVVTKQGFFSTINPFLLAILLPLLAILGTSLVNSYQNNTLLFALIFIVVIITGLVAFNKFIPPRVYPFLTVMMAIALLYQTTLISSNLVGSDIHGEYSLSSIVIENGYWDTTIPLLVNSCLSIVILAPIYSLLLNMDIVWLFKAIYPLFFCLVPLGLFYIWRLQIKPLYAFLATLFFISMPMFTMDMAQLCRQQVSELFFVLVILLMVDRKLTLIQRTTLALIFGFGVVVSYYGMGTGYVGYLAFGALVLIFIKSRPGRTLWQRLVGKSHSLPADLTSAGAFNKKALAVVVGLSLVFMFGYYNFAASGKGLTGTYVATDIAESTVEQLIGGITTPGITTPVVELPGFIQNILARFPFLNPLTKEPLTQTALGLDFPSASLGGKVWRIFQYLVELCFIVGFFRLIFRPKRLDKFKAEYISLTIVSALVLLGIFGLPTWSYGLGTSRIWQITLLLMSPLFLFGGEVIAYSMLKLARVFRGTLASSQLSLDSSAPLRFLILAVLIPYFIFNSGVVFELSRSQTTYFVDIPYSIALSSYRVDITTTFTEQDTAAADWFFKVENESYTMSADYHGIKVFLQRRIWGDLKRYQIFTYSYSDNISYPSYIYLRTWNNENRMLTFATVYAGRQQVSFDIIPGFVQVIDKGNIIYNNNSARVLLLIK